MTLVVIPTCAFCNCKFKPGTRLGLRIKKISLKMCYNCYDNKYKYINNKNKLVNELKD